MADADYRAWAKLLKSKNTDKLLEGISHASDDLAFITSGGGPSKSMRVFVQFYTLSFFLWLTHSVVVPSTHTHPRVQA